jgi:hypothetical protein
MPYRIALTRSAAKELSALPTKTHDKIVEHLRQLEDEPRIFGSEKLTGVSETTASFTRSMTSQRKSASLWWTTESTSISGFGERSSGRRARRPCLIYATSGRPVRNGRGHDRGLVRWTGKMLGEMRNDK